MLVASPFYYDPAKTFEELNRRAKARRERLAEADASSSEESDSDDSDSELSNSTEDSDTFDDDFSRSQSAESFQSGAGTVTFQTIESFETIDTLNDSFTGNMGSLDTDEKKTLGTQKGRVSAITLPSLLNTPVPGASPKQSDGTRRLSAYGSVGSIKSTRSLLKSKISMDFGGTFSSSSKKLLLSQKSLDEHDDAQAQMQKLKPRGSLDSYLSGLSSPARSVQSLSGYSLAGSLTSAKSRLKSKSRSAVLKVKTSTFKFAERHPTLTKTGRLGKTVVLAPAKLGYNVAVGTAWGTVALGKYAYKKWNEPPPPITKQWMLPDLQEGYRERLTTEDFDLMPLKEYYKGKFEEWRADRRAERLDPMILWYEQRARQLNNEEYAEMQRAKREERELAEKRKQEWDTEQERKAWLSYVQKADNDRRMNAVKDRDQENLVDEAMMEMQEVFYFDRYEKRLQREAAEKAAKEAVEAEKARLKLEEEKAEEKAKEKKEAKDGKELTGQALQIMRAHGGIPGVNAPKAIEREDDRETSLFLLLRLNPNPPDAQPKRRKKRGLSSKKFTVDLKRYRMVETIHGQKIGEVGGRALAQDLLLGFCPNLNHLKLNWCDLRYRGAFALFSAFTKGAAPNIVSLEMAGNSIPDAVMQTMVDCFQCGGLPSLLHIDLSKNNVSDHGALAICHSIIAGGFSRLKTFKINKNLIRDTGAYAIYRAIAMERNMIPNIDVFQMRDNPISNDCKLRMNPIPKQLHV